MKAKKGICFDCGAKIGTSGVTVGRMSCDTVWCSICLDCLEKIPCSQKEKKEMLRTQIIMNELLIKQHDTC